MTAPITDNPHEAKKAAAKVHKLPTDNATKMSGGAKTVIYAVLAFFTVVFLGPILFILINSFKSKFAISSDPFSIPVGETFTCEPTRNKGVNFIRLFNRKLEAPKARSRLFIKTA